MLSYYFFYAYSSPYALRLLCFALFPRLSPRQPWQLGTPTKVLPLFYPLGRFERLKTVLMGTNTPHTCIPGLVWQTKARRFSQFELKVGELGFPIHFLCVSAALYHRGQAAAIFSPLVNTVHSHLCMARQECVLHFACICARPLVLNFSFLRKERGLGKECSRVGLHQ